MYFSLTELLLQDSLRAHSMHSYGILHYLHCLLIYLGVESPIEPQIEIYSEKGIYTGSGRFIVILNFKSYAFLKTIELVSSPNPQVKAYIFI